MKFKFASDFELIIEKRKCRVIIEVLVMPDFSLATYVLSICDENSGTKNLMRKFHFDYAPNEVNSNEKKPIYHLQYGGKATPRMINLKVNDDNILPWLSSPRINTTPINLALLLDMVFCEFPSEITTGITERSEWRDLIKNNEDLVTRCYYEGVNSFFKRDHCSNLLFRDFYYGG